jgi:sulfopyruvate decarboxylase beta subunit
MPEPARAVLEIVKRNRIDVVSTLPCEKLSALLQLVAADPSLCHVGLTREENGVGISAGVALAGGRPLMIIQSTGLGNLINALMSLTVTYRLPLPILASWRGVHDEQIEAQVPLGERMPALLAALRVHYTIIESAAQLDLLETVIQDSFVRERPHIALISPRAWAPEAQAKEAPPVCQQKSMAVTCSCAGQAPELTRYEAIRIISEYLTDEAVIANIGVPSKELYAVRDRALNFYMLGSMGQATPIGLGVALRTKRETMVLEGDSSLLMGSCLPTVATISPENLTIICLDNGTCGSTGDQLTPFTGDLAVLAMSVGIANTRAATTEKELRSALAQRYYEPGPRFLHLKVKPGNAAVANVPLTADAIKQRFMAALKSI